MSPGHDLLFDAARELDALGLTNGAEVLRRLCNDPQHAPLAVAGYTLAHSLRGDEPGMIPIGEQIIARLTPRLRRRIVAAVRRMS